MAIPTTPEVIIYKNDVNNTIFIDGSFVGNQFTDTLRARVFSLGDQTVSVQDTSTGKDLFHNILYSRFVDERSAPYGVDPVTVVDALNTVFRATGTPNTDLPRITSSLTIPVTRGDSINYELTADKGVGYEWNNLPNGVVTVEGNVRKLIGGTLLLNGTYTVSATAVNYNGEDTQNIDIIVSNPPYNNTKSINFNNNDYIDTPSSTTLQSVLGRSGNGSGVGDSWTISFYFKPGTSGNTEQTVFYFGGLDPFNDNHCRMYYDGSNGDRNLIFHYGSFFENIELETPSNSLVRQVWSHVMVTYDGGTTGNNPGDINDYYSRFKIFIDGVQQSTVNSNFGNGNIDALNVSQFNIGRYISEHLRGDTRIDEFVLWDSDQSVNIAFIYNSGIPFDYNTLANVPVHWWRFGDGDTFPNLNDNGNAPVSVNLVMNNMTAADIVNDVP